MPAKVLVSTLNQTHDEWLQWRKKGIGGSDAAAIAGLNKWTSEAAVYAEKTGLEVPDEESEAAYWGKTLESVVAEEFSRRSGLKLQRVNAILQHPEYSFMIANLDRKIIEKGNPGVFEAKTAGEYLRDKWEDDRVPDDYMIQMQHYLAVTGWSYGYIAVLIGGNKFRYARIERDQEIIDYLVKIESDFWWKVENQMPPKMDGSESSAEILEYLYPHPEPDSELDLSDEADALLEEYDAAGEAEKEAKERKEVATNQLKALLGNNEVGITRNEHGQEARRVTWKASTRRTLDTDALKNDYPTIYDRYVKTSESRRFSVK
jgi:putative phage-type endonuclease